MCRRPATCRCRATTWPCSQRQLEDQSAEEILRWAAGRYAPRLTFATSLGIEDCVVIDMIARAALPIDIFTLDTGLLFPETYALKERIEQRYGVTIRAVTPEHSVPNRPSGTGRSSGCASRTGAASCERCSRCAPRCPAFDAWITAIRRDQTPERATAPVVGWDGRFGLVKVNPLVRWTFDEVKAYVASTTCRTTRCTIRAIRASAACRAPAP